MGSRFDHAPDGPCAGYASRSYYRNQSLCLLLPTIFHCSAQNKNRVSIQYSVFRTIPGS